MKRVRRFCAVAGFCSFTVGTAFVPAFSDTDNASSFTQVDADGLPVALSDPNRIMTPQREVEMERAKAEAKAQGQPQDWLVNNFATQQQRAGNSSNLYLSIGSNRDLARLAGVPLISTAPGTKAQSNGTDSLPDNQASSSTDAYKWHPLIAPIGSSGMSIASNFSAPGSFLAPAPYSGTGSTATAAPSPDAGLDNSESLDTPGMVAADHSDLASSPDLTLDLLPGETPAEAEQREEQARINPPPINADQLHDQETAQMTPAKPVTAATTTKPTTDKKTTEVATPVPANDDESPIPANKLQPISPVRGPIASPYSILNH